MSYVDDLTRCLHPALFSISTAGAHVSCTQVEGVEETHPPNRERLNKVMAALYKRDKDFEIFYRPVTEEKVCFQHGTALAAKGLSWRMPALSLAAVELVTMLDGPPFDKNTARCCPGLRRYLSTPACGIRQLAGRQPKATALFAATFAVILP